MFAIILLALTLTVSIGIGIGFPRLESKWKEITGNRCEQRLLKGMVEVEVAEEIEAIEAEWKPTAEEIAEAERELEAEMADW